MKGIDKKARLQVSYQSSVCKNCRFNEGYMPCCDKVLCKIYGLADARAKCNYKVCC